MKTIDRIDKFLVEFVDVWTITTNKREFIVMAANKSHAEAQGEEKLKKGEVIKKVMRPKK